MIKFIFSIFMSSDIFFIILFTNIKVSKDLSSKYCKSNKERLQKKACERYQSLFREEKEKKVKDAKI